MEKRFETFTVLVNRISRNIRRIKLQEMADYGLRSTHISCLYYLYVNDGMTATELCERCEEDKATISRALEYLEREGYLTSGTQGAKRYRTPLLLTGKGSEVGRIIAEKIGAVLEGIGSELNDEERLAFYHSLSVISESLERVAQSSVGNYARSSGKKES